MKVARRGVPVRRREQGLLVREGRGAVARRSRQADAAASERRRRKRRCLAHAALGTHAQGRQPLLLVPARGHRRHIWREERRGESCSLSFPPVSSPSRRSVFSFFLLPSASFFFQLRPFFVCLDESVPLQKFADDRSTTEDFAFPLFAALSLPLIVSSIHRISQRAKTHASSLFSRSENRNKETPRTRKEK